MGCDDRVGGRIERSDRLIPLSECLLPELKRRVIDLGAVGNLVRTDTQLDASPRTGTLEDDGRAAAPITRPGE